MTDDLEGRIHGATVNLGTESYCPSCDESFDVNLDSCPVDGSRLIRFEDKPDDLIGRVIDERFEIIEPLGAGGMGIVYRAKQQSVGREVALKVIQRNRTKDRATTKRFLREARLTSSLSHPNVVVIHDVGQDPEGFLYIAMELLEGQTLASVVKQGPLAKERALEITSQLCDALEAAHNRDIVHRDLKPSNVMLVGAPSAPVVKVLDFGIAKSLGNDSTTELTDSNQVLGTPAYIAPEMLRGGESDRRADLYALGCLVFKMLSGREPLPATTVSAALARHLHDIPPRLETDEHIADLVAALLAKDPANRPSSAAEVKARLAAPRPPEPETEPTTAESKPWWPKLVALAAALAFAGVGVALAVSAMDETSTSPVAVPENDAPDASIPIIAEAPADAAPATAAPARITLTIKAKPRGTKVTLPSGETKKTPTEVEVEHGNAPIKLEFTARGRLAVEREVVPDRNRTINVELEKKRPRKPTSSGANNGSGAGSGSASGSADKPPDVEFRVP